MHLRQISQGCAQWWRELKSDFIKQDPARFQGRAYDPYRRTPPPRMTVMRNTYYSHCPHPRKDGRGPAHDAHNCPDPITTTINDYAMDPRD